MTSNETKFNHIKCDVVFAHFDKYIDKPNLVQIKKNSMNFFFF